MNPAIGAYVGVSKQTEMLLMTVLALWVNIFDMAIFEISSNLDQVWNVEIDKDILNPNAEYVIRMLLSGVVLIRTFTLHLYIAFLIAVFWPVCFGTRSTLMLPWLVVSAVKNLGTGLVSVGTGGYTCLTYGPLRPACLRFLLSQLIDLSPSFYMWFVGLSLYCDLKKPKSVNRLQVKAMEDQELNVALRRRRVKSMIDEDILRRQFESRTFQKKFLGTSAVEVNEFINRCSYNNLKNKFSRSLDSLLDVLTVQTELLDIEDSEPLEIDNSSTLQQKTAKLLGISVDEIDYIKQNRQTRTDFPVYPVQPQKKIQTISLINSRYESPAKLLPETSLYSPPNVKPIRVTKSELKSVKDFSINELELIQLVPEKELHVHDLTKDESFESLTKVQTQLVYQSTNSSFKPNFVMYDSAYVENPNLTSKNISGTKEHAGEYSNKYRDRYCPKQDRGKFEENIQIEIPTKYKFNTTMSDKSHYLLDEHSFLFDKESILRNKESSNVVSTFAKRKRSIDHNQNQNPFEEKQRRLDAPTINFLSNSKTRFKDNVMNKKPSLDGKKENKNYKPSITKIKEDVLNKKTLKQSEKTQAIKMKIANSRKMPSNYFTHIPVLNKKSKNEYSIIEKNKVAAKTRKDNVKKNHKNFVSQETKLYTIEETKDIASVSSYGKTINDKIIGENKSITNVLNQEEKNTLFKKESKNEIILRGKEKAVPVLYQEEENILLKNEKLISAKVSQISVTAEIERINKKDSNTLSKNDLCKTMENINDKLRDNKIKNKNYSTDLRIPVPFLSIKHSSVRMTALQREEMNQEKLLPKQEPKSNTSQALSEKILQILKEKNSPPKDKISAEEIVKEKMNKTELVAATNKEFKFTAKHDEKRNSFPDKSSRNKQLEFNFKEKFTKTKDNKMEDLFKKKTAVSERKNSKTSDKDKLDFSSYFINKVNRMITDACQIRKKSCKKNNLFMKGPTNTTLKQRNKNSTIELFRKQSSPKTKLFDVAKKRSTGKLKIPPCNVDKCKDRATNSNKNKQTSNRFEINLLNTKEDKSKKEVYLFDTENKNKQTSNRFEINLINTEEDKSKKELYLFDTEKTESKKPPTENLFVCHKTSSISSFKCLSKTSVHSNDKPPDKTINTTNEVSYISEENNSLSKNMQNNTSLINSFMLFRPDENTNIEMLNTSHKTNNIEVDEPICVTKTKYSISTNAYSKETQLSLPLVKSDTVNDAKYEKTECPFKINESDQKSNTSTAAQKTIFQTISENRNCKKLSEQAMNKLISITNADYSTNANEFTNDTIALNQCFNTLVKKFNCKRLSEQAISKVFSLRNTRYSILSNRQSTDRKLNTPIVQETLNCKKLSDFAINKLFAITSPKHTSKTSMTYNKPSLIMFSTTKIENNEGILKEENVLLDIKHDVISINVTKSENLNHTISDGASITEESDDFNKSLNATQSENSDNLHLNESNSLKESRTKVTRKCSTPVIKEDIAIGPLTKIENNNEMESSTSDLKWIKSHVIALVEDALNTKSAREINNPIRDNFKKDAAHNITLTISTNNVFSNNLNRNLIENISPVENQNISIIDTDIKHCKEASQLDSSIEIESLNKTHYPSNSQRVDKNFKWISQDCINIFTSNSTNTSFNEIMSSTEENQNIPNIKNEIKSESSKELISPSKEDLSPKEENIFSTKEGKNEYKIKTNYLCNEAKLTTEIIQTNPNNKEENILKWIPQGCIELIPSNNCGPVSTPKREQNIFVTNNKELNCEDKLNTPPSTSNTNISVTNEEKNKDISQDSNNSNIPVIKVEKECKSTSQHSIKLISTTDENCVKNSDNIVKLVNEENSNVSMIKHEHKGSLQNNSKLLSSRLYKKAHGSNQPLKETKVCKGTSQHYINLISSIKRESSSETNLFHNVKKPSQTKEDLYKPLKEQKVCRGSAQNYVKLISPGKEEFASNINFSHKEALANILKEYQPIHIVKKEKVCKGTSKHKIKLISSYKKDSPNKINLFHTKTKYKNDKNENITIIKEENNCIGTLQHSIKLLSSSKNDSRSKTIFIVKEQQLPKPKETVIKDNNEQTSTSRSSIQTNVFVNMDTANGKQNLTVIQKHNDIEYAQRGTQHEVNLFINDRTTSTDECNIYRTEEDNLDEENQMETFRKIITNTFQELLECDTEKVIKDTDTNLVSTNKKVDVHPLIHRNSSFILSSLINNVEASLKLQDSTKVDLFNEESRYPKNHSNQIDFGCQTSTLSKKVLENNRNDVAEKISRTKSNTKSTPTKSYQDLNLQKLAYTMTTNINSSSKLETKSTNENLSKDEKKDSTIALYSRSSRNVSYVNIHKERLEKAKCSESNLSKSVILQNCGFLEDGYTRLYNLLGVKQENFDTKPCEKMESSFKF